MATKHNGNGANGHDDDWAYLCGEIRDALLTQIRSLDKPWAKQPEARQADIAYAIEQTAKHVIRNAVAVVSRRGFDSIAVTLGKFGVDGGKVKGTFETLVSEQTVLALADHQKATVQLVLASADDFYGQRAPAEVDPDQPDMIEGKRLPPPDDWPMDQPEAQ